ncbi:MAG: YhjD/YihY/BrkB family envelope integrity protein [Nakamurella sp.]
MTSHAPVPGPGAADADASTTGVPLRVSSVPGTGTPVGSPAENPTTVIPRPAADLPSTPLPSTDQSRTGTQPADPQPAVDAQHPAAEDADRAGHRTKTTWHRPGTGPIPVVPGVKASHRWRKIAKRAASKTWNDSLFGWSSQAAFWCALSTAPLLLALLGMVGFVAGWYGPDTIQQVEEQVITFLNTIFSSGIVDDLLKPSVHNLLTQGQADVVSVGFVISLWAGSSAISAFVEAITIAYGQHEVRHPVAERFFALGLYLVALVCGIFLLPLAAIGPTTLVNLFPPDWRNTVSTIVDIAYFPVVGILCIVLLTTLYKVAPKHRHPWKRGIPGAVLATVFFLIGSHGLRIYVSYVTGHGLSYGALATPIVFLLFYYFLAMSIIIGAQFNNATLEYYPPKRSKRQLRAWRRLDAEKFEAKEEAHRQALEAGHAPEDGNERAWGTAPSGRAQPLPGRSDL